jgi:hypothetical protein
VQCVHSHQEKGKLNEMLLFWKGMDIVDLGWGEGGAGVDTELGQGNIKLNPIVKGWLLKNV